ncbi:MAG: MBL fold metallo-hydrolase [Oscillibacter sp.]|nr:MBL fold metallo-hydrolase [Oscillibacter sp.]
MLVLDFINVGNGDSILVQEVTAGQRRFAMLVDCGHDNLIRDDHTAPLDPRSQRIYAGDFLREQGIAHLDLLLATHFHRDHIGGLGRVLEAAEVSRFLAAYLPPADSGPLEPDGDNGLPGAARNLLRCLDIYASALRAHPGRVHAFEEVAGDRAETLQLTEDLSMDILPGEPALYPRQRAVFDAAFRGERNRYDLMRWTKSMNISSLRQRLHYHGKEIVLGGDMYCAVWDNETLTPCDILKVPHHASLSSCNRKAISRLAPKTMVVSVAAGRPDERPHPYIVSLLKEYAEELYFTDAVDIPGLVEPVFHRSVHLEVE